MKIFDMIISKVSFFLNFYNYGYFKLKKKGVPTFKELIIYLRVVINELANNVNTVTGPE